jgi:hypothetical protein
MEVQSQPRRAQMQVTGGNVVGGGDKGACLAEIIHVACPQGAGRGCIDL